MCKSDVLQLVIKGAKRAQSASSDYDLNKQHAPQTAPKLRKAAILLPFVEAPTGLHVILTKRSGALRHHPGQIAFPGGKIDAIDAGQAKNAALREAQEEIGLAPDNVEILGKLPRHETATGFSIEPILGRVIQDFDPRPEMGEVDEVFTVPFDFLSKPSNYKISTIRWQGSERRFYSIPHGPYYIWGATARILRVLAGGMSA